MQPEVSVILPTYNRVETLGRAIRSVLKQSHKNFELIIIDDASTDGTESLVNSFTDDRIQYIKHEVNRGAAAARNTGFSRSNGEYIAFIDSDDIWFPEKLDKQYTCLSKTSADTGAVYCRLFRSDNHNFMPSPGEETEKNIYEELHLRNVLTSQPVVKKKCIDKVGGQDENLRALNDWDLWLRIAREYKFIFLDSTLYWYRAHQESISANNSLIKKSQKQFFQKHKSNIFKVLKKKLKILKETIRENCNGRKILIRGTGEAGQRAKKILEALDINISGFVHPGANPENTVAGLPVFDPADISTENVFLVVESVYSEEIKVELSQKNHISPEDFIVNKVKNILSNFVLETIGIKKIIDIALKLSPNF